MTEFDDFKNHFMSGIRQKVKGIADLEMRGHNHFVVGKIFGRLPRVAQTQQPWALLRNLFEIVPHPGPWLAQPFRDCPHPGPPQQRRCRKNTDRRNDTPVARLGGMKNLQAGLITD
jgi:hypothetical protein